MNEIKLYSLPTIFKKFLALTLITLMVGISVGLVYLGRTTKFTPKDTIERYNGKQEIDELEMGLPTGKPVEELLITTHSHVISFAFIIFIVGGIFYFSSFPENRWKNFLLFEPPLSAIITFSSIWGFRYIHEGFIIVTIVSAILLYSSLYLMMIWSLKDLLKK